MVLLTPFLHVMTTTPADWLCLLVFLEPVKKFLELVLSIVFKILPSYLWTPSQSRSTQVVNVCSTVLPLSAVLLLSLPLNLLLHRSTSLAQSHRFSHIHKPFSSEIEFCNKFQTTEAMAWRDANTFCKLSEWFNSQEPWFCFSKVIFTCTKLKSGKFKAAAFHKGPINSIQLIYTASLFNPLSEAWLLHA